MPYKEPALAEMYVKVRFQPGGLASKKLIDLLPILKGQGQSEVEFAPMMEISPEETGTFKPKIRCWNEKRTHLIQLSTDQFIVNQTKPYLGWIPYLDFVRKSLGALEKAGIGKNFRDFTYGTVDHIIVPAEGFSLSHWVNCGGRFVPSYYKDVRLPSDLDIGQGFIEPDGENTQFHVRVRLEPPNMKIRIETAFARTVENEAALYPMLEKLHDEEYKAFEDIITDRVRIEVMKGKVKK